jgi:hypothetical protein
MSWGIPVSVVAAKLRMLVNDVAAAAVCDAARAEIKVGRGEVRKGKFHVPVKGAVRTVCRRVHHLRDELGRESDYESIGEYCQPPDSLQDGEPDANVLDALGHWTSVVDEKLLGVEAQLEDVVEEGEERSQGKGRDEDCNETVLDD